MDRALNFDEVDTSWFDNIDDEIGLFWENDEIEEKFDPNYQPERYKHLKIPTHKEYHTT